MKPSPEEKFYFKQIESRVIKQLLESENVDRPTYNKWSYSKKVEAVARLWSSTLPFPPANPVLLSDPVN